MTVNVRGDQITVLYKMERSMKLVFVIVFGMLVQACGTVNYIPEEYTITNDRIDDLDLKGQVSVVNVQTDSSKRIFFDASMDWVGDYKTVTEHLKNQLDKELSENTVAVSQGEPKSIEVKVTEISAEQKFFHFVSEMSVDYILGNGESGSVKVSQGSPGNMWRVLNGTIALGVIEILKEDKVITYLAQ